MPGLKNIYRYFLCIVVLFYSQFVLPQASRRHVNILFYQLNTAHGLSDNYIWDMCMDKNGNLWIASGEGLNMFNGKSVTKFFKSEHPQLENDYLRQVKCDDKNRIWVMSRGGYVTMIDENRKFHKISLYESGERIANRWMLYTKEQGIVLFTRKGFFFLSPQAKVNLMDSLGNQAFSFLKIENFDTLLGKGFLQMEPLDENNDILSRQEGFFNVNFKEKKVERKYSIPDLYILIQWQPGELLAYNKQIPELQSINLLTQQVTYPLRNVRDQFGEPFTSVISNARMLNNELLLLTTQNNGMFLFNTKTKMLTSYRHNAADPTTIVNNAPQAITISDNKWVFLGATPNGISYFKSDAVIGQQSIFMDKKGNSYDGYINNMATLDNDNFYIGTGNNLLKWKRSTNTTTFIDYAANGQSQLNKLYTNHLSFDFDNRLWFAASGQGIFVMDRNERAIKQFYFDTTRKNNLISATTNYIGPGPDGFMWLATGSGVCRINPATFIIDRLETTTLARLKNVFCYRLFFSDDNNLWIATNGKGLYHYSFSDNQIRNYTTQNGFISNVVFCINKDKNENIYAGTDRGLQIFLHNGKTKQVTQNDGLMNSRVEALLLDKKNRMWIGNDVGIACFSIADTSLRYFDETYGLSIQGFRVDSYCQTPDDELIWGTERGLQYFYPGDLYNYKSELKININRIETRKVVTDLTQDNSFSLAASDNYVTFHFSTIEYLAQLRTFYEYKLEGLDADWIKVVNQNFVRYSSLPPGKYTFRVRASNDNKHWQESGNEITITIAAQFYKTWWFKTLGMVIGLIIIWYVLRYFRRKQIRQKEELETELVINYFASRINAHQQEDELLWDVVKNCISRLNFEDCVIYIKDDERNVLVQKAAYGPKNPVDFTIHQPIEIPVGKGIVGTVAQTGRPILVADTKKDKRYIVDDARRFSELAVPIIISGKLIGVIDSEHHQKNFYTQRHLNILSAVAVLCVNQIQRIRAEQEKQKAEIEIMQNKQKAAESRLQSLRLQMNPHFLFNALNSVQQMILANEEMVATKYLSKFSKLLRAILVHSDRETISLKEEMEILSLYVELESIRFRDSFQYRIECDEEIDTDEVKIATLLVQPFVENAIWHGLMHKEGERKLFISFKEENDFIRCSIEDNGVGRNKAAELEMLDGQRSSHTSKGIAVSKERLKTMKTKDDREGSITIIDLTDENNYPCGTRVEINFPIQN